jgi:hypothetical protein
MRVLFRMNRGVMTAVVAAVLAVAAPARAESPFALTVRVYDAAGLGVHQINAALQEAAPILRDTGIEVTFRRCGVAVAATNGPVDRCDDTLKPHEVVVRIIDAPKASADLDPLAFGLTYVVADTNQGWLATVFADRVATTAARVRLDPGTLTGLVLAHEVGHLLLGQNYHGDAGVMRAQWPDQLLAGSVREAWRFSSTEAAVIQRRLITR